MIYLVQISHVFQILLPQKQILYVHKLVVTAFIMFFKKKNIQKSFIKGTSRLTLTICSICLKRTCMINY